VIPEAPFLFSVAALSVTLAGFAGLVAAFRRGGEWTSMTVFRLREIAEFGLGNALVALLAIPLATTLGDLAAALRICGAIGVVFVIAGGLLLIRRRRRLALPPELSWYVLGGATDVGRASRRRSRVLSCCSSGSSSSCFRGRWSRSRSCSLPFDMTEGRFVRVSLDRAVAYRRADGNVSDKEKSGLTNPRL
jgi:hypothetical protein